MIRLDGAAIIASLPGAAQLFKNMDAIVGKDFEAGQANLKAVAEK